MSLAKLPAGLRNFGGGNNAVGENGVVVSIEREIGDLHVGLGSQIDHHVVNAAGEGGLDRRAARPGPQDRDARLGVNGVGNRIDAGGKVDGVARLGGADGGVDRRRVVNTAVGIGAVLGHVQRRRRRRRRLPKRRAQQKQASEHPKDSPITAHDPSQIVCESTAPAFIVSKPQFLSTTLP